MRWKRYKFTDKKHSGSGIISSSLGACALFLFGGSFASAYLQGGQAGKWIAVMGFISLVFACAGLYHGFLGTQEEDVYPLFPYLGCVLNGMLLLAFVVIYFLGW